MQVVMAEMNSLNIPYKVEDDGSIWYMQKDKAEVLGIIRKAKYGNTLGEYIFESVVAINELEKQLIISKLDERKIPYRINNYSGSINISYSQLYGPRVDQVMEEVGFEFDQKSN